MSPVGTEAEDDGADVVPIESARDLYMHDRGRRPHEVRARTEKVKQLSRVRLRVLAEEAGEYPEGVERPRTRGDCVDGPRPCGFVSCRHHLAVDVHPLTGAIKWNRPDVPVDEMEPSCSLDVADDGTRTLEEVGALMNVTRERIRQMANRASEHFVEVAGPRLAAEFRESVFEALNRPSDDERGYAAESDGGGGKGHTRKRDMIGLSLRDAREVERETNEIVALLSEGVPFPVAQALASEPFEGPEDPPVCLAPPLLDREPGTRVPVFGAASRAPEVEMAVPREKVEELEARRTAVIKLLRERGPVARSVVAGELGLTLGQSNKTLRGMRAAGLAVMSGKKSQALWMLPGERRPPWRAPEKPAPKVRTHAPPPPLAKLAKSATYGTGDDPVAVLAAMRAKVLAEVSEKQAAAEKLADAIRALGGAVD